MLYSWERDDPIMFRASDLPEVTPDQLKILYKDVRELLIGLGYEIGDSSRIEPREARVVGSFDRGKRDEDIPALCRAALAVIPNDVDREEWIDICFAIRDAGLGYSEWQDWCHRWEHGTNSEREIRQAWNGCNPRQITYRTLLRKADQVCPSWRKEYKDQQARERNRKWIDQMRDWKAA